MQQTLPTTKATTAAATRIESEIEKQENLLKQNRGYFVKNESKVQLGKDSIKNLYGTITTGVNDHKSTAKLSEAAEEATSTSGEHYLREAGNIMRHLMRL